MKKIAKSFLAVLLCAAIFATVLVVPASAEWKTMNTVIPTVYVEGGGKDIYNTQGEKINDKDIPDGYIANAVSECLPLFFKAYVTGDYEEYKLALGEYLFPFFEAYQLNGNGEVTDGSHMSSVYTGGTLPNYLNGNGCYILGYKFYYDWRTDTCESAEMLNTYINAVKSATGCDKVNIVGRCEGSCVLVAYLAKYGYGDIAKLLYYVPAVMGLDDVTNTFSGNISFEAESIDRWASYNIDIEDDLLSELLFTTINMAKKTYGLDIATAVVNATYKKMFTSILPYLIMGSYGTMPSMWSMVKEEDWDDAMAFIFSNEESKTEYAGLIEKITHYHDSVMVNIDEILEQANTLNIPAAVVLKYGYQSKPISERTNNELSDGNTILKDLSFGATTAKIGETFSDYYVTARTAEGKGDFISVDRQVDASTCVYPETTWFIKGMYHDDFPDYMNYYYADYFNTENYNVYSDPAFPRFCSYDSETQTLSPMTNENTDVNAWTQIEGGMFTSIVKFFRAIFAYLKNLLKGMGSIIPV